MADTTSQLKAEKWVVEKFLPKLFEGVSFRARKLDLKWGGTFAFDAVSDDGKIVGCVSTSDPSTASGKAAMAKFHKIRADALFLLHVKEAGHLFMIFTEDSMAEHFRKEQISGRFPPEILLLHAQLEGKIRAAVRKSRARASAETSPGRRRNSSRRSRE